ncbi:unnamed protein product, partial [Prorocentrum cordatum]
AAVVALSCSSLRQRLARPRAPCAHRRVPRSRQRLRSGGDHDRLRGDGHAPVLPDAHRVGGRHRPLAGPARGGRGAGGRGRGGVADARLRRWWTWAGPPCGCGSAPAAAPDSPRLRRPPARRPQRVRCWARRAAWRCASAAARGSRGSPPSRGCQGTTWTARAGREEGLLEAVVVARPTVRGGVTFLHEEALRAWLPAGRALQLAPLCRLDDFHIDDGSGPWLRDRICTTAWQAEC